MKNTDRPAGQTVALSRQALLCVALVALGPAARAEADLTALSLEQLMDIRVVGASKYDQKQSEVAAAVSIITRDEIRAFGWRTIEQALATLPGIHISNDHQYVYLGTRGFGLPGDFNTRVLVSINGNRLNDATFDGGPMGRTFPLDMDLIERIEFIPGPGGAVYGQNAMFGVINVVTRSAANLNGTELAVSAQQPQRRREGRASWGGPLGHGIDLLVSISGQSSQGVDRQFDFGSSGVSGVAQGLDGSRTSQVYANLARGPWSIELVAGDHRKDDPTGAYRSDPLVAGQYQRDRYVVTQGQYQDRFLGDTLQVLGRLFTGQERYSSDLSYGTTFSYPAVSTWSGAELRGVYTGLASHKLMLGAEFQANTRVDQNVLDKSNPANDVSIRSPGSRRGLYAQDEWRLTDTLAATFGVRVDDNSTTGTKTSPRAGLIWQAASSTTFKALYGRAHRAPNAYERDYQDSVAQIANPALHGERIDTAELVADHRVNSTLNLRGTVYQWAMSDLVTLGIDPVSGLAQYQSGGLVKAKGMELSADKTWAWGGRLRTSVSLQNVRDGSGGRLLNSPQLLGKLSLSTPLPLGDLRLGYTLQYDSPRRTLDGSDTGGYSVSNLHLSTRTLGQGIELSLSVQNLFDKHYAHPGADTNWQNALAQDGRSLRIAARFHF